MRSSSIAIAPALCGLIAIAGCASVTPDASPIHTIPAGPNPFPRGTVAFCERYAAQTYNSTFRIQKIMSSDAWAEQQAKISAQAANRRCLEGRTN